MNFSQRIFLALIGGSLTTGLAGSFVIYKTVQDHERSEYAAVYRVRVQLLAEMSHELRARQFQEVAGVLHRMIDADPDLDRIEIFSPDGRSLERVNSTGIADGSDAEPALLQADQEAWREDRLVVSRASGGYRFVASISPHRLQASLASFRAKFAGIVLVMILVAIALAGWITAVLSRKVGRIRDGIDRRTRDPGAAFEVPVERNSAGQPRDELDLLASNFNDMVRAVRESQERVLEARKSEAQAAIAAQVAHDIRSPLTSMTLALGALQQGVTSDALSTMKHGIDRVAGILRKLSNTYGRKTETDAESVELPRLTLLDHVFRNVVAEHEVKLAGSIQVAVEGFAPVPGLWGVVQVTEIQSAVSNLLNNAAEAVPPDQGRIRVSLSRAGSQAMLAIEDNGVGIAPENLERIFERRFTLGKPRGTGLGLSQAKAAAEWNGGKITVRSEPGHGSCFTLALPTEKKPGWIVSELAVKPGTRIVFVDDDPSVLSLWRTRMAAVPDLRPEYFKSLEDLKRSVPTRPWPEEAILVIDQFLGPESSGTRGLDFLTQLDLRERGFLCTSEFDDPEIQAQIRKAGLRLIPKPWITAFSITTKGPCDADIDR